MPPKGKGRRVAVDVTPARPAGMPSAHVEAIGVKRPGFGTAGRQANVFTNCFETTTIPSGVIYHYDVVISGQKLPVARNLQLIARLQSVTAPTIFDPRAVYDGRANMFSSHELRFAGGSDSQEFEVDLSDTPAPEGRKTRTQKIKLVKVNEINLEVLDRYIAGEQSGDNNVLTAITALNVVIRMDPISNHPFNARSFFTSLGSRDIGSGLVLWRGYFQSIRPAIGRMMVNIDISTGVMYKPGPLIAVCLDALNVNIQTLVSMTANPQGRHRLERFLKHMRVITKHEGSANKKARLRFHTITSLTRQGANIEKFTPREGGASTTIANYYKTANNTVLKFPTLVCAKIGDREDAARLPLEVCEVPPGQLYKGEVPSEKITDILSFSTKKPHERLASIKDGLTVLGYGQSQYLRQFGIGVNETVGPLKIPARVLQPPALMYGAGPGAKQVKLMASNGSWNMVGKRFHRPAVIQRWVIVIYETKRFFSEIAGQTLAKGILDCCDKVGIKVEDRKPNCYWENGQGVVAEQLRRIGNDCLQKTKAHPTLIVAVLPEGLTDIYPAIKHFGNITAGVATQCLRARKCTRANEQYFMNVCLKINARLGGVNHIIDSTSPVSLSDSRNSTIVMGADVMHPGPGAVDRPSYAALVGSVDPHASKYVATSSAQLGRQEIISDFQSMSKDILTKYMQYQQHVEKIAAGSTAPKRIILYRDGVAEGQFAQVLEKELPLLKKACNELNIKPKITLVIVGKRHHIRFFPMAPAEGDRSGNCHAGTVIDREITHPIDFDFYLQSHGGLLGTSRPAHYNIIYDENEFKPDAFQALSFALCHTYAPATRSVSIPAPVYYADKQCSRAKNHYDPQSTIFNSSDTASQAGSDQAEATQQRFQQGYKPVNPKMLTQMYFI